MIRRDAGDDWLLISQIDHAHLAAEIASAWGNDDVDPLPMADLLVPAIRDHDDGWRDWESAPQIDPDLGWPRNFTEMPMRDATEIWSKSIDICARGDSPLTGATSVFRQFLQLRGQSLTDERKVVLDVVAKIGIPFLAERVFHLITEAQLRVGRATVYRTISLLEEAGLIRFVQQLTGDVVDQFYVAHLESHPTSSLAGSWVSRHFCWLAEKTNESRVADPAEVEVVEQFLSEQRTQQLAWLANPGFTTTHANFNKLSKTGFRWLQFFDRLSLWLCCAERTQPFNVTSPHETAFACVPCRRDKIIVDPFPLGVDELELSVTARHVPARVYSNDEELQDAVRDAGLQELTWVISR